MNMLIFVMPFVSLLVIRAYVNNHQKYYYEQQSMLSQSNYELGLD